MPSGLSLSGLTDEDAVTQRHMKQARAMTGAWLLKFGGNFAVQTLSEMELIQRKIQGVKVSVFTHVYRDV